MFDPLFSSDNEKQALRRIKRLYFSGFWALLAERIIQHLWRPVLWISGFAALWLFDLVSGLGIGLQWTVSITFYLGLGVLIWRDVLRFRWPRRSDIERRIEDKAALAHRPLSTLTDTLSNPEKAQTKELWQKRKKALLPLVDKLISFAPAPDLARRDPYGLRYIIPFIALIAVIMAARQDAITPRLQNGLLPPVTALEDGSNAYTLWLTPPEYTRQKQNILQADIDEDMPLALPEGTMLKIIAQKRFPAGAPALKTGDNTYPLEKLEEDGKTFALEMKVPEGKKLTLSEMMIPRASWHYRLRPDNPPQLSVQDAPKTLRNAALQFFFTMLDDYGVETLSMDIDISPEVGEKPLGKPVSETRSVMSPSNAEFHFAPVYDLSAHPWAGLPAEFTFTAYDHLKQESKSETIKITLPERDFEHPAAKALIEVRKKLAWSPLADYRVLATEVEDILVQPNLYQGDFKIFLALRSAASRLAYANPPSEEVAYSLMRLLWDTALRLEDGNLSLAARDLRQAQLDLERAMNDPQTSDEDISRLMAELREKMSNYMREMMREMQKRMARGEMDTSPMSPENMGRMITPQVMEQMMRQMEENMRSGNQQDAREMLSRLQNLLDMMNPSMQMALPKDMQMMQDTIKGMGEVLQKQKQLKSETENLAENMGDLPQSSAEAKGKQTEQDALRYTLGQLMLEADEVLGKIPGNMGEAEQAMRRSGEALGQGSAQSALPQQEQAIEALEEAQRQMASSLAQRYQQMTGFAMSGGRYDPLGRPYGMENDPNGAPGNYVEIPGPGEIKRAQEILDLLRRRSGELNRPREELDYFRRLLKRF